MIATIRVDQNDIIKILAQHFNVPESQVDLIPFITTVGYGLGETTEARVYADITDKNFKFFQKEEERDSWLNPSDNWGCYT